MPLGDWARRSAVYGRASRGFQTPVNNSRRDNLRCVIAGCAPGPGSGSAIGWEWIWFGIIRRLSPDRTSVRVLASPTATPEWLPAFEMPQVPLPYPVFDDPVGIVTVAAAE